MTGVVPVNPRTKFTNSSGVPYAGGTLTVYLAGTTTLATTYQDKTLLSANTNPIALDANGECLLWVDSGSTYKFLLKDSAGATVSGYPVDNIPGAADIGAAVSAAADWATKTDAAVSGSLYSAKEYAQGTQASTGGSAKNWAQQTGADVTGASANSRSAKSWAQDALTGATLGGSAKDWAQSASPPDGTSKSAKSYAADAATARDEALAATKIYVDTTAGLAAVSNGEYFYVPSSDSGETLILYRDVSGFATEVKRYTNSVSTIATRAAFSGAAGSVPRLIQITADELHGGQSTMNYWDGKSLRYIAEYEPTPAGVLSSSNSGGMYALNLGAMFQDAFAQTPVTASGQTCAMLLDARGKDLGGNLIVAPSSFSALAGVVYDDAAGTITCTAATGDIAVSGITTIGEKYWADFDLSRAAGTVNPKIGVNTTTNLSTSGRKSVFISNTSGTNFVFTFAGFTGVIYSPMLRKDSRQHLIRDGVMSLPTYTIDAAGVPYLSGGQLTSSYPVSATIPVYMAAALTRVTRAAVTMCNIYDASGNGASITNTNSPEVTANAQIGGAATAVYSRSGSAPVNYPFVIDVQAKAGATTSWVDGGNRDVADFTGNPGASRTTANAYGGGATVTTAVFNTNYNNGSTHRFHGAVWAVGIEPTNAQRKDVHKWLRNQCGLGRLDEGYYDVFIIAGQSNAMGVGDYTTSTTPTIGTAAEYLDNGGIKPLVDPTQHSAYGSSNVSLTGSAWPSFGSTYYSLLARRACIVGAAFSGVGLLHDGSGPAGGWQSTGPLVRHAATKAAAARSRLESMGCSARIRGVIWQGGEQDVLAAFTVASYKTALISLRDRFRQATGVYDLPLYIVSMDKSSTPATEVLYALIRQAQSEAASENDGIELVVSYQNYYDAGNSDGVHLNQTALNDVGVKAATAIAALIA